MNSSQLSRANRSGRYPKSCQHAGVLYLHRVESNPANERKTMQDHLRSFANAFAGKVPVRLHVVATFDKASSTLEENVIEERKLSLRHQMKSLSGVAQWQSSMFDGTFDGNPETAWAAAEELLSVCGLDGNVGGRR